VVVQQPPQGGGRSAKLVLDLLQRPCLGDHTVHQVAPQILEAECGRAVGGALLGGVLALTGKPLPAGELAELVVGDGAADGRLGGIQVAGKLGDAPAVVQEGLQAAARVGEVQACGLLVEVALLAVGDGEAAAEDQAARLAGCLWCFPMRSECRAPYHSGRPAIIRASIETAHPRLGDTERIGKTSGRLTQKAGRGGNWQLRARDGVSGTHRINA
jgi:hypothetical protein